MTKVIRLPKDTDVVVNLVRFADVYNAVQRTHDKDLLKSFSKLMGKKFPIKTIRKIAEMKP